MERIQFLILLLLFVIITPDIKSQNIDSLLNNKRVYNAKSIGSYPSPKIDGLLDDKIWVLGKWQSDFTQQQPHGGSKATEKTYVKVLYDHNNLYVAIICHDKDPGKIRDIFDRRDGRSGDMTGIAIDSYFDKRTAFEFSLSAAGQKLDVKHLGDTQFDINWDAVWDGATSRNDTAWIAEMSIPFSQIRYTNQEEHVWGMHVWRGISRKHEYVNWQYIPVEAPAMVYLFGELKGVKNIRNSRQVEFLPYALSSIVNNKGKSGTDPFKFNGGIDSKVGISSDYTLDLSINPDFGQVEADPSVLNLTAFETFFEEKRPFFMEGNEIFDYEIGGDIPYYSRRIGSAPSFPEKYHSWEISEIPDRTMILSAAKLTGKSKKGLSVGVVNGLTAREFGKATKESDLEKEIEVAPLSNYMVSRIKKEFQEGNTIVGGVFSLVSRISGDSVSTELLPSSAITGGFDLLHQWRNRNYFLKVKAIASQLDGSQEAILKKQLTHNHLFQRPDANHIEVDSLMERLSGHGGLISVGKKGGKWNYKLQGQYRSSGLNLNDMGYIRQSDFFGQRFEISYNMNVPKKWIRSYTLQLYHEALWSFGGENTGNQLGINFKSLNNKLWRLNMTLRYDFSHLNIRELRGGPGLRNDKQTSIGISVTSNRAKDLYGSVEFRHVAFGVENSSQDFLQLGVTWFPLRKLKISGFADLDQREYHQQYVTTISGNTTDQYIVGNINRHTTSFTFRGELFLTPELSLQYYGSPYYSVGKYDSFRRVDQASSKDINNRLEYLDVSYDALSDNYIFERNSETLSFGNPDFSFMQFRSNVVFRWEYKLGSTLYLVWSHDRTGWQSEYNPVRDITGDLFKIKGNHVFMVKLNYWFSV